MPGARGPAPSPMAAHPALSERSGAAGSAGHDSADGDQAGNWRRRTSLLPPQAPPPPSMRSPQAQPRRGRGGRGGAALPPRPPGPCASSDGRRQPRHPQDRRTWVGAGTLRRAAAAAARGGREWGAVAGARLMTSQPGCGSAGARTWLRRRRRRRPRAALGPERPAPSCGAARQSARPRVHRPAASRLPVAWGLRLSSLPWPNCREPGVRGRQGARGGNRKALREPPGGATP